MLRRGAARVCAAALLASGCGGPGMSEACRAKLGEAPSAAPSPGEQPQFDSRLECGPNTLRVSGAVDAKVDGPLVLRVVETIIRPRTPRIAWFLSAATAETLRLSDGSNLKVAFDIAPGFYSGDGSYVITGRESPVTAGRGVTSPLKPGAFVELINPTTRPATYVKFDRPAEPCALTVSRHGSRGSLVCPRLSDESGRSVSVSWSWSTLREG